jgi:hypothetical protein
MLVAGDGPASARARELTHRRGMDIQSVCRADDHLFLHYAGRPG